MKSKNVTLKYSTYAPLSTVFILNMTFHNDVRLIPSSRGGRLFKPEGK